MKGATSDGIGEDSRGPETVCSYSHTKKLMHTKSLMGCGNSTVYYILNNLSTCVTLPCLVDLICVIGLGITFCDSLRTHFFQLNIHVWFYLARIVITLSK